MIFNTAPEKYDAQMVWQEQISKKVIILEEHLSQIGQKLLQFGHQSALIKNLEGRVDKLEAKLIKLIDNVANQVKQLQLTLMPAQYIEQGAGEMKELNSNLKELENEFQKFKETSHKQQNSYSQHQKQEDRAKNYQTQQIKDLKMNDKLIPRQQSSKQEQSYRWEQNKLEQSYHRDQSFKQDQTTKYDQSFRGQEQGIKLEQRIEVEVVPPLSSYQALKQSIKNLKTPPPKNDSAQDIGNFYNSISNSQRYIKNKQKNNIFLMEVLLGIQTNQFNIENILEYNMNNKWLFLFYEQIYQLLKHFQ